MSTRTPALGRGLGALLPGSPPPASQSAPPPATQDPARGATELPVDQIEPNPEQPRRIFDPKELDDEGIERARERINDFGIDASAWTADQIRQVLIARAESFENDAPVTAAEAAEVILTGVREQRWRILVGDDAHVLDEMVRAEPEQAYEREFFERFAKRVGWVLGS